MQATHGSSLRMKTSPHEALGGVMGSAGHLAERSREAKEHVRDQKTVLSVMQAESTTKPTPPPPRRKLGWATKGGSGRTITVKDLHGTRRGMKAAGANAVMDLMRRAKHATEVGEVSKRDVKDFLAGATFGAQASEIDTGMTWVAASAVMNSARHMLKRAASANQSKLTHQAISTTPAVRTARQKTLVRELVESVPLFENVSKAEMDALGAVLHATEYTDGDVIMTEGEVGEEFCIILEGKVDVFIGGRHARRAKGRQWSRTMSQVRQSHDGTGDGNLSPAQAMQERLKKIRHKRKPLIVPKSDDRSSAPTTVPNRQGLERAHPPSMKNMSNRRGFADEGEDVDTKLADSSVTYNRDGTQRRNIHSDTPRIPREKMPADELKEWEGVKVGQMDVGATFGELALLDEEGLRTATAVSIGRVVLAEISRHDFTKLIAKLIQEKTESRLLVLHKHYAFGLWSTERLIKLCNFLLPFNFPRNTIIADQGARVQHVFVITSGTVRLEKTVSGDDEVDDVLMQMRAPGEPGEPGDQGASRVTDPHQVYSPRPNPRTGHGLVPNAQGEMKVEIALLGPGSILGDAEIAAGAGVYQGTFVATSEVKGFTIKASEFLNRLDTTTLTTLRNVGQDILTSRIERVSGVSGHGQREAECRQEIDRLHDDHAHASSAAPPAPQVGNNPGGSLNSGRGRPMPRRGTLGLHISLGLCPGGAQAMPIDPVESLMRDLDEHAGKRMDLIHASSEPVFVPKSEEEASLRKRRSRRAGVVAAAPNRVVTQQEAVTASILHGVCGLSPDVGGDLEDIRRQYGHSGSPRAGFRPVPPQSSSPTSLRGGTPQRNKRCEAQVWKRIAGDTALGGGRQAIMPADKLKREKAGRAGFGATFGRGGYQTILAGAKMKAMLEKSRARDVNAPRPGAASTRKGHGVSGLESYHLSLERRAQSR